MKITIIYDNTACTDSLRTGWGFACLVEKEGAPKVLFDAGAEPAIMMENMRTLNINPADIGLIVVSHDHWDHTGGLEAILNSNSKARVYAPLNFSGTSHEERIARLGEPLELPGGIFLTGEIGGIEQALAVESQRGLAVLVGCAHPGLDKILAAAREFGPIHAVIGGFHDFANYASLEGISLICACHCSEHRAEIREAYPEAFAEGGVGRVFTF